LRSQLIVRGRSLGSLPYREIVARKPELLAAVSGALDRLRSRHQLLVLEGAGSPAEINLHAHDLPNLAATRCADARAILVADIDRGGAFAALVGTLELLPDDIRTRMCGLVLNKLRGDATLLADGLTFLERRTGLPVLGVVPHLGEVGLPDEDSLAQTRYRNRPRAALGELEIAVVDTPCLANFEDVLPLARERGVVVRLTAAARELLEADLVILPGSKATVHDLRFVRETGIDDALLRRAERGDPLLGICGGAQLLGRRIEDPAHVEGEEVVVDALGILPHSTRYLEEKRTEQVSGRLCGFGLDARVSGFVLHHGRIIEREGPPALMLADGTPEGVAADSCMATMLHRLFDEDGARAALLSWLRARRGVPAPQRAADGGDPYDVLADHIEAHLDCQRLFALVTGEAD
jgi:adenosylcobyric acid synthase